MLPEQKDKVVGVAGEAWQVGSCRLVIVWPTSKLVVLIVAPASAALTSTSWLVA